MDKKVVKLNSLLQEVKALIDEINENEETTNFSIIRAEVTYNNKFPQVQLYSGISQFPVPTTSIIREWEDGGDFVEDYLYIGDVRYYEVDAEKKEAGKRAEMAV